VPIKVLDMLALKPDEVESGAGHDGVLGCGAGAQIAERHSELSGTAPLLVVREIDDLDEFAIDIQRHALADVTCINHSFVSTGECTDRFGDVVRFSALSSVISNTSSIRTPPQSGIYSPGSTVMTLPGARVSSDRMLADGASWTRKPSP